VGKTKTVLISVLLAIILAASAIIYFTQTGTSQPVYPPEIYSPKTPSENQKVACIVFDDGWASQLEAIPILDNFGFKATFAIVTSYVGRTYYMAWDQIATLAKNGHDIESHSCDHISLNSLSNESLFYQVTQSQQGLRSKGYAANIFVYPFGDGSNNGTVRNVVSEYYLLARATSKGSFNIASVERYSVNAFGITNTTSIQQFESYLNSTKGDVCTILYYHRIGDGSVNTMVTKDQFQTQMQYLKDNNYTIKTMDQLFLKPAPEKLN
jgi:peptidoglycan/xylan/chitin deacetylase (PgdA/CDA1 family)